MSAPEVLEALLQLEDSPANSRPTRYNTLLSKIVSTTSDEHLGPNLIAYAESILGDSNGIVTSRPLLASFVEEYRNLQDANTKIEVGTRVLEILQPRVVSFEEQDTKIKESLSDAYQELEDYSGAAKVLQTITLDSSQRAISDDDKAQIWIRIVRCYLEDDDPTNAMSYLNHVKNVLFHVQDKATKLMFQLSQARILDSQRQFLEASASYHGVSFEADVDEAERLMVLGKAITCAVLAPAGPTRAKTLARLYKDERASTIEQFGILEKIFLDRILSPEQVKAFETTLEQHQLAKTADGSTVLEKAVLEHNLLAASRLYSNIGFDELGVLLGVNAERAESYAAQMIEQGRLAGYIDQIDRFIFFEGEGSGERKTKHAERAVGKEVRKWDANVQSLAEEVEKITTLIQNRQPEFYEENMAH
ncbi:COP9 signalosome-like protein complex subunit 4 [Pseudovirgaria hyperparasitica]|uniref:COP9 signalosome complex subunit 4 n=1 Tax=Pseudovirgaria hyperparasitica TaxID=470096 RepID=A0A6A6VV78_9PEZI|nr:COP9 signalosome-like protein complex subunit 4 [Pseudovirgaria hyperparasitica]KAF2754133.1 COP9 signalosome-like protein complex subunit 4 [Pseudovirgaria hyperparasitica]